MIRLTAFDPEGFKIWHERQLEQSRYECQKHGEYPPRVFLVCRRCPVSGEIHPAPAPFLALPQSFGGDGAKTAFETGVRHLAAGTSDGDGLIGSLAAQEDFARERGNRLPGPSDVGNPVDDIRVDRAKVENHDGGIEFIGRKS